jgi:hypothetical protein
VLRRLLRSEGSNGLHWNGAVLATMLTRNMFFLTTTGDGKGAFLAAAIYNSFKRAYLTTALVTRGQRAEMPAATGRAATQTAKILGNIVLLHHEIVPTNVSLPFFDDDAVHLSQYFHFIARSVAFRNAVSDFSRQLGAPRCNAALCFAIQRNGGFSFGQGTRSGS